MNRKAVLHNLLGYCLLGALIYLTLWLLREGYQGFFVLCALFTGVFYVVIG